MINDNFSMMSRRELLAVSAGLASALLPATVQLAAEDDLPEFRIIDTNVSLFQWPFRRLPLDNSVSLVKKLHALGIAEAWAGSFEGVLQRDIAGVNARLAGECRKHRMLTPVGSVNPTLPGWQDDLRRCIEEHGMRGIRLHPNYHGYTLDAPAFTRLLELATEAGRFVQIAVSMEDTRTQHEQLRVPDVNLAPLVRVLKGMPRARVQLLNYRPRPPLLNQLADLPGVYFETARIDGTDAVPKLVQGVPSGRVLFGTHSPFLIPEAALIRLHESDLLDKPTLRAVLSGNAERVRKGNIT